VVENGCGIRRPPSVIAVLRVDRPNDSIWTQLEAFADAARTISR